MSDKRKFILSAVGIILNCVLMVVAAYLTELKIISEFFSIILIVILTVVTLAICFYAAKVDWRISVFECRCCGHTFKPTFGAYVGGAHTIKKRYLACPECGKKSWCLRKNDTENL